MKLIIAITIAFIACVVCIEGRHGVPYILRGGHGENRVIPFAEQNQAIAAFEATEPQRQFDMLMRHKDELPAFQGKTVEKTKGTTPGGIIR